MRRAAARGTPTLFADTTRRPDLPWTAEQRAIFKFVEDSMARTRAGLPPRNLAVESVAGSSKTTLANECLYRVPPGGPTLVLAYNKSVKEAMAARAPSHVRVETLHSYGFKMLCSVWGPLAPSPRRDREVLGRFLPSNMPPQGRAFARRLYGLSRADCASDPAGVLATLAKRNPWLRPRRRDPDEPPPPLLPHGYGMIDLAKWVSDALRASLVSSQSIAYDEMCSLPVALKFGHAEYGFVVVDEFQDLSPVQIELALGAVAPGGMLMGVGDPRQSIYGFRGADPRAMEVFVARTGAHVLGMTASMRCSEAVAEAVRAYVPDFHARPGAPAGSVSARGWSEALESITAGPPGEAMVISRTSAPLMTACLDLWRSGVRARIQGKDLVKSLKRLVAEAEQAAAGRGEAQAVPVRDLVSWLRAHVRADSERYDEDDVADGAGTELRDTAAALEVLSEGLRDTEAVQGRINALFSPSKDPGPTVLLGTVHAVKGLERPSVYVLPTFHSGVEDEQLAAEERNLIYVALSRSSRDLCRVTNVPGE